MSGSADDDRTAVTQLDLAVKKKRFCNQKYDVKSSHRNYLTIMASLPNLFNDKSVFCASSQGRDSGTCGGDSGGPVVQFDDDFEDGEIPKWVQIGAVHGSVANCDGSRFPSIFVRLDEPKILEWIFQLVFPDKLSSLQNHQNPPRSRPTAPKPPRNRPTTPKPPRSRPNTPKPVGNSGNGPVTKGDCEYTCLKNKGCQSRSTRGGAGRSQGSCFPQSFGGGCFGIPENCQDCNEIVDCEAGTGAGTGSGFGSGSSSSGSRVSNGQAQCVTTCNSNGGCSVKIVNGPPGKSSGSCFPPDFKGRCSGIPDLCARGNHISTQCGSPCQAGTRNI